MKERVPGWAIGVIVGMAVLVVIIVVSFIIYVSSLTITQLLSFDHTRTYV